MSSYNKLIMMGNLTRDPTLSYLPSNTPVADFGIATNRKWKDKGGNPQEEVCFVDCRAFSKTAETINQYFKKGGSILIEGRLQFDQWTAQDNTKRSKHRAFVERFSFVGDQQQQQQQGHTPPSPPQGYEAHPAAPAPPPPPGPLPEDSEIPF